MRLSSLRTEPNHRSAGSWVLGFEVLPKWPSKDNTTRNHDMHFRKYSCIICIHVCVIACGSQVFERCNITSQCVFFMVQKCYHCYKHSYKVNGWNHHSLLCMHAIYESIRKFCDSGQLCKSFSILLLTWLEGIYTIQQTPIPSINYYAQWLHSDWTVSV